MIDIKPLAMGPRAELAVTFGGKTYTLTKLGNLGLIELERWLREMPHDLLVRAVQEKKVPYNISVPMLREAWDRSQSMLLLSPAGRMFAVQSVEATTRTIWMAAREKHPDVTFDQIAEWLPADEMIGEGLTELSMALIGYLAPQNPTQPPAGETSTTGQ